MAVKVSSKGQLTLPVEARRRLGIRAGTKLEIIVKGDDRLEIVRIGGTVRDVKGVLGKPSKALSLAQIEEAIARGARGSRR